METKNTISLSDVGNVKDALQNRATNRDDAEAQMLVAMLIAQQKNKDNKIIYGGWFRGKNWHFTTLSGNQYCVAPTLIATKPEELKQIVCMLQHLKVIILGR